jgi:hypothetical protein
LRICESRKVVSNYVYSDIELSDDGDALNAQFCHGKTKHTITLQVSDYPDSTVLLGEDEPTMLEGNLLKIFDKIVSGAPAFSKFVFPSPRLPIHLWPCSATLSFLC